MSTIACAKSFSIEIEPAIIPSAWWKLEEASGNRIDQVGSYVLADTNGNVTSNAGKVGQASLHTSSPVPVQSILATSAYIAALNLKPAGVSFAGWFRFTSGTIADCALFAPLIQWSASGKTVTLSIQYNLSVFGAGLQLVLGDNFVPPGVAVATVPYTPSLGTWQFVLGTYDPVTGSLSLLLNNTISGAAVSALNTGNAIFAAWIGGAGADFSAFSFSLDSDAISAATAQFDEMCVFNSVLSASDKAFLWNGGVGKTYPF